MYFGTYDKINITFAIFVALGPAYGKMTITSIVQFTGLWVYNVLKYPDTMFDASRYTTRECVTILHVVAVDFLLKAH